MNNPLPGAGPAAAAAIVASRPPVYNGITTFLNPVGFNLTPLEKLRIIDKYHDLAKRGREFGRFGDILPRIVGKFTSSSFAAVLLNQTLSRYTNTQSFPIALTFSNGWEDTPFRTLTDPAFPQNQSSPGTRPLTDTQKYNYFSSFLTHYDNTFNKLSKRLLHDISVPATAPETPILDWISSCTNMKKVDPKHWVLREPSSGGYFDSDMRREMFPHLNHDGPDKAVIGYSVDAVAGRLSGLIRYYLFCIRIMFPECIGDSAESGSDTICASGRTPDFIPGVDTAAPISEYKIVNNQMVANDVSPGIGEYAFSYDIYGYFTSNLREFVYRMWRLRDSFNNNLSRSINDAETDIGVANGALGAAITTELGLLNQAVIAANNAAKTAVIAATTNTAGTQWKQSLNAMS